MTLLIAGVALWWAAHLFKRLVPGLRAKLGEPGKGLVAVLLVLSVILMVLGYRAADGAVYWTRNPMWVGINNLLMIVAFYFFAASAAQGAKIWLGTKVRHPQLTAISIWAIASFTKLFYYEIIIEIKVLPIYVSSLIFLYFTVCQYLGYKINLEAIRA